MAENHLTTEQAEKRVKSIKEHLESLHHAANFLNNLTNHLNELQEKTADLSLDTLNYFACIMDMAVNTISAELGMLKYEGRPHAEAYMRKPQAPEGGEA